ISPEMEFKPVSPLYAITSGAYQCWYWTRFTIVTLASKIYHRQDPDLAGPVGIVHMVGQAAHSGLDNLVYLIGLISVAIGIFNLFPIPILDGGHTMLYLWEGISRRKLTEKLIRSTNNVGFAVLISIFLFATYSDFARIYKARRASAQQKAAAAETAASTATVSAQEQPAAKPSADKK
ncbi:MAG TPA: site-2 protease family protein, partial [Elusimicrobiales bacterium]|nr:site-2 protease family protein [Elusimicrobiales bacterium]